MTDRFPFLRMYKKMADRLPTKEAQADFYTILVEYALDDKEPEQDGYASAVFEAARAVIDNWKSKAKAGREGGIAKAKHKDDTGLAEVSTELAEVSTTEQKDKRLKVEKTKGVNDEKRQRAQECMDAYNAICRSLPKARSLTEDRIRHVNARLKERGPDKIREVFERAEKSDWLSGRKTDWRADFDWLINGNNQVKVLEGRYDNRNKAIDTTVADVQRIGMTQEESEEMEAIFR